ncbi:YkvA family protein [Acaryochloris sp. IP29b_bin.148]|uniref:YkvA family protein n=1 Tax=Acaryochloris sp. IP29b_bin.148 TaxID=2969218 RepID=UPI00260AF3D5|nr:YkvA family protein [Acaryochloris sp. IP29b_bin.148]
MNFSIKALYQWYRNSLRNPKYRAWIIVGTLAYLFSPFDISPDLFPIVGQIDDLALLTLFISEISQLWIENYKQRQVSTQPDTNASNPHTPDTSETVDVDAVPVQD